MNMNMDEALQKIVERLDLIELTAQNLKTVVRSLTSLDADKGSPAPSVSAESKQRLRRMGLDPKYAGITNEDQLLEVAAAAGALDAKH